MDRRRALFAVFGIIALGLAFFHVSFLSERGAKASGEIAASATAVYVSLRAVNAALSVSQEIEVGATLGASASAQPLKVLEPIDDTVERIASVVFAVASVAWILSVAFQPVSEVGFALLGLSLLVLATFGSWDWVVGPAHAGVRIGVIFAVVVPLVFVGGAWIGRAATEGQHVEAVARLDAVATEARDLIGRGEQSTEEEADDGFLADVWNRVGGVGEQVTQFTSAADYYWERSDEVLAASFQLIAVYVLRIVLLPMLLLFVLWRLLGRLI